MYTECPLVRPSYPAGLLERSRQLLAGIVDLLPAGPMARGAANLVLARYPAYASEMGRLARLLSVDPVDLALANLSYDLSMTLFGCSTLVLASRGGPVVARNMDWMLPDRIARASCLLELPAGLSAGFIGAVGVVTGLSRYGFAVVLNAVSTGELDPAGYPVLLFLRHLLDEARSFEQAVDMASTTPLASSALLTLAGSENRQRVCVERTPTLHRQRWPAEDEPLLVTNHFRQLAAPHPCPRHDYLMRHVPRLPARGADELLALLADDNVRQDITAQHVLAWPAEGRLRLFVPTALLGPHAHRGDDVASMRRLF
jgi:isopenicillin-N N-acyltransferase-like protein